MYQNQDQDPDITDQHSPYLDCVLKVSIILYHFFVHSHNDRRTSTTTNNNIFVQLAQA